jgi:hypothetical protein
MRTLLIGTAVAPLLIHLAACARKQDDAAPPGVATASTAYPTAYPPQGYAQPQPVYAQPQAQPYPAQYPAATATYAQPMPAPPPPAPTAAPMPAPPAAPAATSGMAVPGPLAFQCQNDVPCGTHHCNVQYSKCAFPCQSAADCISPNQCLAGLCVPTAPTPH